MQYHQNSKLNTRSQRITQHSGLKVQQITFEKQITQQWRVKTDQPEQLLPYSLRHLYLSRLCEFWHQMKFLYFQNYQQICKHSSLHHQVKESSTEKVQVVISAKRLQICKAVFKAIWKVSRNRLIGALNRIKQQSSFQQQQSSEIQPQTLNSYMRFLKLQQDRRIDIAVQNLQSVLEKNTRRKLLTAFLNMFKSTKKDQVYSDRITVECFVDIVERAFRNTDRSLVHDCFGRIIQSSRAVRTKRQTKQLQTRQRQIKQFKRSQNVAQTQQNKHYESVSHKKSNDSHEYGQSVNKKSTINKYHHNITPSQKDNFNSKNNISTIKRQPHLPQRRSNVNSIVSEFNSHIKSINNEEIIHSEYYYDRFQQQENSHRNKEDQLQSMNRLRAKMNSLPTKRNQYNHGSKIPYDQNQLINNLYSVDEVQYNLGSQILQKKTKRTYKHNEISSKQLSSSEQQILSYMNHHQNLKIPANNKYSRQELHIPITQRIQKHQYEENYEQQIQNNAEQSESYGQEQAVQQIYIIRNHSKTPKRKPDQFVKVPITSNNINFVQIPANPRKSNHRTSQKVHTSHSNSYYERKSCQNCPYCLRLKNINSLVQKFNKQKNAWTKKQTPTNIHSFMDRQTIEQRTERNGNKNLGSYLKDNFQQKNSQGYEWSNTYANVKSQNKNIASNALKSTFQMQPIVFQQNDILDPKKTDYNQEMEGKYYSKKTTQMTPSRASFKSVKKSRHKSVSQGKYFTRKQIK